MKFFDASNCSLTVVRDFYFKKMTTVFTLNLGVNQIKTIEAKAFDDLISLKELFLQDNMIETLEENLFEKMVTLLEIHLSNNKIKFLSPTTFVRLGRGILKLLDLRWNVCIDKAYDWDILNRLKHDLGNKCSQ